MISLIVAMSENRVIGRNNQLPWHLPADLKFFKQVTMGNTIIMGRKTYESIGKPLPGRQTVIITRNKDYKQEGCVVVNSITEAIGQLDPAKEHFIIGGGEIFKESLRLADKVYLTIIHENFEGDVYFPELDPKAWKLVKKETHTPDDKNHYSYSFCEYKKLDTFIQS